MRRKRVLHSDQKRGQEESWLPSPTPRHNKTESKEQAQKSIRSLHSRVFAGSELQYPCVQAGDAPNGESCQGKTLRGSRVHPQHHALPIGLHCSAWISTPRLLEGNRQADKLVLGGTHLEKIQWDLQQRLETATFGPHLPEAAAPAWKDACS